jgi:Mg2+ and Co2+ transporter CorA
MHYFLPLPTARSPILTHLKSTLDGLDTIRSLHRQHTTIDTYNSLLDTVHGRYWTNLSRYNWYNLRMNMTVALFTMCTVLVYMVSAQCRY